MTTAIIKLHIDQNNLVSNAAVIKKQYDEIVLTNVHKIKTNNTHTIFVMHADHVEFDNALEVAILSTRILEYRLIRTKA